jgi:hypothetical protein
MFIAALFTIAKLWMQQGRGPEEKQTGCVLIMRQRERMAKQRDKT